MVLGDERFGTRHAISWLRQSAFTRERVVESNAMKPTARISQRPWFEVLVAETIDCAAKPLIPADLATPSGLEPVESANNPKPTTRHQRGGKHPEEHAERHGPGDERPADVEVAHQGLPPGVHRGDVVAKRLGGALRLLDEHIDPCAPRRYRPPAGVRPSVEDVSTGSSSAVGFSSVIEAVPAAEAVAGGRRRRGGRSGGTVIGAWGRVATDGG